MLTWSEAEGSCTLIGTSSSPYIGGAGGLKYETPLAVVGGMGLYTPSMLTDMIRAEPRLLVADVGMPGVDKPLPFWWAEEAFRRGKARIALPVLKPILCEWEVAE